MRKYRGFTLIELLVAVAVIGILAGVAIPAYVGYVQSSRERVASTNLQTLKLAEEAYFFEHQAYKDGTYGPSVTDTLTSDLGWTPNLDGRQFTYTVTVAPCTKSTSPACYTITIVGFDGKVTVTDNNDV